MMNNQAAARLDIFERVTVSQEFAAYFKWLGADA